MTAPREPFTSTGDELLTDIINDPEAPSYHVIGMVRRAIPDIEEEAAALDVQLLYEAMLGLDTLNPGIFNIVAISDPDTRPVAAALAAEYSRLRATPSEPVEAPEEEGPAT